MNLDVQKIKNGLVSIVIVTRNRKALLQQCLASCLSQTYKELEVIVIDNASTDDTVEMMQQKFPQVKRISMHTNLGFFPVLNIAIANSFGEYIMTVDDDAYFTTENDIEALVNCFKQDAALGAATCNLIGPKETPITKGDRYIRVFTTGFTMVSRKVFSEWVGFYPDVFFRSAGETYVCSRLWDMGKTVKRFQNIVMYHELALQGRSDRDWKFYGLRSQLLCVIMREPGLYLLPSLFSKLFKSFFQFIKWKHTTTWFRVFFSFIGNLRTAVKLRGPVSVKTWKKFKQLDRQYITDLQQIN